MIVIFICSKTSPGPVRTGFLWFFAILVPFFIFMEDQTGSGSPKNGSEFYL